MCVFISGFGNNVVIQSTSEAGDVLIDTSGDFTLQNITLKPLLHQIGMVHHNGRLLLKEVILEGMAWIFIAFIW